MNLEPERAEQLAKTYISLSASRAQTFLGLDKRDDEQIGSRHILISLLNLDEQWQPSTSFTISCLEAMVAHGCRTLHGLDGEMSTEDALAWRTHLVICVMKQLQSRLGIDVHKLKDTLIIAETAHSDEDAADKMLRMLLSHISADFTIPGVSSTQAAGDSTDRTRAARYLVLRLNFQRSTLLTWRDVFQYERESYR
jgi:hypothetical protein